MEQLQRWIKYYYTIHLELSTNITNQKATGCDCCQVFDTLCCVVPLVTADHNNDKKVDISSDTIKSACNRNNKRYPFHRSMHCFLTVLLKRSQQQVSADTSNKASVSLNFKQVNAARYNEKNTDKRYKNHHSVLGGLADTGATPWGRGKSKRLLENANNYQDFKERTDDCMGCPARFFKP